jgi:protein-S-isoprenylcysteine O-methyltransferase Ste14
MKLLILFSLLAIFISLAGMASGFYIKHKAAAYDVTAFQKERANTDEMTEAIFWAKVFFSATFCMAAFFVVLSKRYDEETKKWAFSVLTLIAGVWIGTITQ